VSDRDRATPRLEALTGRLEASLSVEWWGYEQLADISDEQQRAIVSDQILVTARAVAVNLREAADHQANVVSLVGPNGRAMLDPAQPEEYQQLYDLDRELVGFFRAAGSLLDCLAALAIGALRLPFSIQRADAGDLGRIAAQAQRADEPLASVWTRASEAVERVRTGSPDGWLEWTIEMRNAVIHRARQLQTWLPRASRQAGQPQFIVRSNQPVWRLVRYEPHPRRRPWLPDLLALASAQGAEDNWLAEPATVTLAGTLSRLLALVEGLAAVLLEVSDEAAAGHVQLPAPVDRWRIGPTSPAWRVAAAESFLGFELDTPTVPLDSIAMSPVDARQVQIADGLRRRRPTAED
jgi:hypothetical protein